jgi:hypothetical protein
MSPARSPVMRDIAPGPMTPPREVGALLRAAERVETVDVGRFAIATDYRRFLVRVTIEQ